MACYTIYKCPHCGQFLDRKPGPEWDREEIREARIFKCPRCKGLITDGMREWEDKSQADKAVYILKCVWWTFLSILLALPVSALFGFLLEKIKLTSVEKSMIYSFPIFAILWAWWTIHNIRKEIKESIERTAKKDPAPSKEEKKWQPRHRVTSRLGSRANINDVIGQKAKPRPNS